MACLLLLLCILLGGWMVGGLCAQPITQFIRRYWSVFTYEGEHFLLWGGLLLSAFGVGLLVMYLVLAV